MKIFLIKSESWITPTWASKELKLAGSKKFLKTLLK